MMPTRRSTSSPHVRLLCLILCLTLVLPVSLLASWRWTAATAVEASSQPSMPPGAPAQAGSRAGRRAGELLIRFRQDVTEQDLAAMLQSKGMRRKGGLKGKSGLEKLELSPQQDIDAMLAELRSEPSVELVEPNFLITKDEVIPDDERFAEQWALRNQGQPSGEAGADIKVTEAWDTTTGSRDTVIAVIDSGIDFTHPDLQGNQWVNRDEEANRRDEDRNGFRDDLHGWDWVSGSGEIKDEQGHGTLVAGLIAAQGNNAQGVSGVMWQASLMSLRVLDQTGTGDIASAVEAVDYAVAHGAQVINCSWGSNDASRALYDAIERAANRGVVVVTSAGNSGRNIDAEPYYPAAYDLPNIIAVASTDNSDRLAGWSNWGAARVHLAAPGVNLLTTAMGGGYQSVSGSSASAPLVSGVAGLVKTQRPRLKAESTRTILINASRSTAELSGRVASSGIIQAAETLRMAVFLPPDNDLEEQAGEDEKERDNEHGRGNNGIGPRPESERNVPPHKLGIPAMNLPDLDDSRQRRHAVPETPAPIPSTHRYCHPDDLTCGEAETRARHSDQASLKPNASPSPQPPPGTVKQNGSKWKSALEMPEFSQTISSAAIGASLSGSKAIPSSAVNLTQQGTEDWAHWGLVNQTSFNYKSIQTRSTTHNISNYSVIGAATPGQYGDNRFAYSWGDGIPTTTSTTTGGVLINGVGNGFMITAPADNTTMRTLKVYVGVWYAKGRIEATMSDGSAPAYVDSSVDATDVAYGVYTFNYRAASSGQSIIIKYTMQTTYFDPYGNITLQAATLTDPSGVNYSTARLDPRNRTGEDGDDLLSRNFNWSLPLLNLPGRAGLDLSLALTYNSLVWTKSGTSIAYDLDRGYPGPGFQLGFPKVHRSRYFNPVTGKYAYLLITPAGKHIELRQDVNSNVYYSADNSYLQMIENGSLTLKTPDGAQWVYFLHNNEFRCFRITDRNGNMITIRYQPSGGILDIQDSLGRIITFNHDANSQLSSITQTWRNEQTLQNETHQWATFGYSPISINTNFTGLTVNGPQATTVSLLTHVGLPDGSRYSFEYTVYGQVWKISHFAGDGHIMAYTTYNVYDGTPQTDCPRFTHRRDWALNWNEQPAGSGTFVEVLATYTIPAPASWTLPNGTVRSGVMSQVTLPDGTVNREYSDPSSWRYGQPERIETFSSDNLSAAKKTTHIEYTSMNELVNYPIDPRPRDITVSDSNGNRRRTHFDYTGYGLVADVYEYGTNDSAWLRRTHTDYLLTTPYADRRILGLRQQQQVYDELGRMVSKVTYAYDEGGDLMVSQGAAVQHDSVAYSTGFLQGRGNMTSIRRWNVDAPDDITQSVENKMGYNIQGSMILSRDPLGSATRQTTISYTDSFTDGFNRSTLAYPTRVTDTDGYSTSTQYHYDMGVLTSQTTPKPNTAQNLAGPTQTMRYDMVGRIKEIVNSVNAAKTRFEYPIDNIYIHTYSTLVEGQPEAHSWQVFDGAGRVIGKAADHPGSPGGYSAQHIVYDTMGRVAKESIPTAINNLWNPVDEDLNDTIAAGWYYRRQTYDWKGRPRITNNSDNTQIEVIYGGCGCAGGEVVTHIDEVGRQQRITNDQLGREEKIEDLVAGSVYSTIIKKYNARDQVTEMIERVGTSGTSQSTTTEYDGYGREWKTKTPEATAPTIKEYFADDTVKKVTDARTAVTNYTYNNRGLVTSVTYGTLSGVPQAPNLGYGYDAAGNRQWMTDGAGRVDYDYNMLSQINFENRQFTSVTNPTSSDGKYKLTYEYTLGGSVKSIIDPFNSRIDYAYDSVGRITGMSGTVFTGITQYTSDMKYRASGAIKSANYGDGLNLNVRYNTRFSTSLYDLKNSAGTRQMSASYEYYNDGRLRFVDDLREDRFDRLYEYDDLGRVKKAETGYRARGAAYPGNNSQNGPYNHYYGYDAFDNLTSRTGHYWYRESGENYSASYVNNRNQNTGWQYDADGRETQTVVPGSTTTYTQVFTYNTAGQRTDVGEYDGDGETVKSSDGTTRFVRSTVLGGKVISEVWSEAYNIYFEFGRKIKTYVYLGDEPLAEQKRTYFNKPAGEEWLVWKRKDPAQTSVHINDYSTSSFNTPQLRQLALDIQGIATEAPDYARLSQSPTTYSQSYNSYNYSGYGNYSSSGWGSTGGMPGNFGSGCTIDGGAAPCSFAIQLFNSNAAWQCPPTGCGPQNIGGQLVPFNSSTGTWTSNTMGWTQGYGVINANTGAGWYQRRSQRQGRPRENQRRSNPQSSPTQTQTPASMAPNGLASDRKLTDEECDKKLSEIFGGVARAMVNSDIRGKGRGNDGHTAIPRNDRPKYWYSGNERYRYDRGGIIHTYTDGRGSARTDVGLYTPGNWVGTPVNYYDKKEGNSGLRFTYSTGLTISFVHVGTTNPSKVPSVPSNAPGSVRIGYVGGFGGEGEGYFHTHIIFYSDFKKDKRVDPRQVFCGF